MILPTSSPGLVSADHDHRDLVTALKLLSGQDCKRDAAQAQVLLVGLTESRHKDVAEDARAIMRAGLKRGWFEDTAPKYFELRNIAEQTLANYEKAPANVQRSLLLAVAGLLLFLGLGAFLVVQKTPDQPPFVMIAIAVFLVIIAGLGVFAKSRQGGV